MTRDGMTYSVVEQRDVELQDHGLLPTIAYVWQLVVTEYIQEVFSADGKLLVAQKWVNVLNDGRYLLE